MKIFITLILIVLCLNAVAEKQPEPKNNSMLVLEKKVDSLSKTVENLSIEKNFFQTTLSSQTTTYSTIVMILLGIIGLFSYLSIYVQNKISESKIKELLSAQRIENKTHLDKQTEKFNLVESDMEKQKIQISKALCNTFVTLALNKDLSSIHKFRFSIFAAIHANNQKETEFAAVCLKNAAFWFTKIIESPAESAEFNDSPVKKELLSTIKEIVQSEDTILTDLAIDLISKINNLTVPIIV